MSLKGTCILWTDLVVDYPNESFILLDDEGHRGMMFESDFRSIRAIMCKFDWTLDEWEDNGFEVVRPQE